jgi:high-affinity nickel-transport protein
MDGLLAAASDDGFRIGLIATTYWFGVRHGFDWDHIAAISDITSSQETTRRSMVFSTLYALGHGAVVFALGVVAIVAGDYLPDSVDAAMERVVGVTLLVLGAYVIYSLIRHGRDFRMRSRWMLMFSGVARTAQWLRRHRPGAVVEVEHDHAHRAGHGHDDPSRSPEADHAAEAVAVRTTHSHPHRHVGTVPQDPFVTYGRATSVGVGMLHGVGAETPTQVLLFLTAAQAGGTVAGVFLLLVFVAGLLTSNTVVAVMSTYGYLNATRRFAVYATVAMITAAFSLALGALFLLGEGSVLPAIFAG